MTLTSNARAAITAAKQRQAANADLSIAQEQKLKAKLRRSAPSEPWVEVQIRAVVERDKKGQAFVRRYHDARVFPPGGGETKMRRCLKCRRWTPPQCCENEVCLDHSEHSGWGPSPSAVAIGMLEYFNRRPPQVELAPQSIRALKLEIEQHHASAAGVPTGGIDEYASRGETPAARTSAVLENAKSAC